MTEPTYAPGDIAAFDQSVAASKEALNTLIDNYRQNTADGFDDVQNMTSLWQAFVEDEDEKGPTGEEMLKSVASLLVVAIQRLAQDRVR